MTGQSVSGGGLNFAPVPVLAPPAEQISLATTLAELFPFKAAGDFESA